jgi:hypothetical protein
MTTADICYKCGIHNPDHSQYTCVFQCEIPLCSGRHQTFEHKCELCIQVGNVKDRFEYMYNHSWQYCKYRCKVRGCEEKHVYDTHRCSICSGNDHIETECLYECRGVACKVCHEKIICPFEIDIHDTFIDTCAQLNLLNKDTIGLISEFMIGEEEAKKYIKMIYQIRASIKVDRVRENRYQKQQILKKEKSKDKKKKKKKKKKNY